MCVCVCERERERGGGGGTKGGSERRESEDRMESLEEIYLLSFMLLNVHRSHIRLIRGGEGVEGRVPMTSSSLRSSCPGLPVPNSTL